MRIKQFGMGILMLAAVSLATPTTGQAAEGGPDVSPEQMQEMMAKWQATMKPGPKHENLAHFVGKWNTESKMWWEGPGTEPDITKGTAEVKWMLGKRYVVEEFDSKVLMPNEKGEKSPLPFHGFNMTGFDNYKNLYVGNWADDMSTMMYTYSGTSDPSGKVFTFYGQMDEPMLDIHGRMIKTVIHIVNDDKHVFEMYDLAVGDGYKGMEITYTRQK